MNHTKTSFAMMSLLWLFPLAVAAQEGPAPEPPAGGAHLFVISSSTAEDEAQKPLKYADDDALAYLEILRPYTKTQRVFAQLDDESREMWGSSDTAIKEPDKAVILAEFAELSTRMEKEGPGTLFLVLAGHGSVDSSGEGYLVLPGGERLEKSDISDMLELVRMHRVNLIVDTCNAFDLVQPRGGWQEDTEEGDYTKEINALYSAGSFSEKFPNVGFILASASNVKSYELGAYQGGVFSLMVRSGLLGAADADRNGLIDYSELGSFAAAAVAGITNSLARPAYYIAGPKDEPSRALLTLGAGTGLMMISVDISAHVWIEDSRSYRLLELNSALDGKMQLYLPAVHMPFRVYRDNGEEEEYGGTILESGAALSALDFAGTDTAARAGSQAMMIESGLFKVPFGMGFHQGYRSGERNGAMNVGRSAVLDRPTDWMVHAGYRGGQAPFNLGGMFHGVAAGIDYVINRYLWAGVIGSFSNSGHTLLGDSFTVQRYSAGIVTGFTWPGLLGRTLAPYAEAEFGHQWLVKSNGGDTHGDPLSLIAGGRLGLSAVLGKGLLVRVSGGVAFQVVTLGSSERGDSYPYFDAGLGYRF